MERGRPTDYRDEFAAQAEKLAALGATDQEIADFFEMMPTEEDWLLTCLLLIRQDRRRVFAHQKKRRSVGRAKRVKANPSLRLRGNVSTRIWSALKGRTNGSIFSRLPYGVDQLRDHLERQFSDGMTWENYGKWHVDHIVPCAAFDLTDPEQFERCWALNNLQPLWASDNCRKGARYVAA
jgi:hypothetical protein